MATDTRDQRAIGAVVCPRCNAWAGSPCFFKGAAAPVRHGKPFCHAERRAAWLEWKHQQEAKTP
jgi:hypothetical protein